MDITEVEFIKDTQSQQTGNEFYPAGARVHFFANQADVLVDQGRVFVIGAPPAEAPYPAPEPMPPLKLSYRSMTVKQLRAEAHDRGMSTTGLRKAEIIAAFEEL